MASSNTTRMSYAKDGKGFDFSSSYKYASKSPAATSLKAPAATFTGCRYAKDGKGFNFNSAYKYSHQQQTEEDTIYLSSASANNSFVGDDGLFRGVYDLGQRAVKPIEAANAFSSSHFYPSPSFFGRDSTSMMSRNS